MHGSVRKELENLLKAKPSARADGGSTHISACEQCALELAAMRLQAEMMKSLQAPAMEPAGGFYARVLQRIEQSARRSIWWVFAYSPVGMRVAFASLALSIALGAYVVAAERNDGHWSAPNPLRNAALVHQHYDPLVMGSADQQRAAVLANFVSHPVGQAGLEPVSTLQ